VPKFGTVFRKPTTGKKAGTPPTIEEIRSLIEASAGQLRAMILLGINCAYQAADCAALPPSAIDVKHHLVRFPRVKMRDRKPIDRVAVLWPLTEEALSNVLRDRPGDALVFRTIHGKPWVRNGFSKTGKGSGIDSVGLMYGRLCASQSPKIAGRRFADLRHVFRTIADELEKPNAAARIMGHRLPGLAEVYVDSIEHERLREITDHVFWRVFTGWAIHINRTRQEQPGDAPAQQKLSRPSRKPR